MAAPHDPWCPERSPAGNCTKTKCFTLAGAMVNLIDELPSGNDLEFSDELLQRGHQRFDIFCANCHGQAGYGDGMIVQRGFRRPPSFHIDRLRNMPLGYFFDVMTNGFGAMPTYNLQVDPRDRWAIAAYRAGVATQPERSAGRRAGGRAPKSWRGSDERPHDSRRAWIRFSRAALVVGLAAAVILGGVALVVAGRSAADFARLPDRVFLFSRTVARFVRAVDDSWADRRPLGNVRRPVAVGGGHAAAAVGSVVLADRLRRRAVVSLGRA